MKYTKNKQTSRLALKAASKAYKAKGLRDYYTDLFKVIRLDTFFRSLADKGREERAFGVSPLLLPEHYADTKDKVFAVFVSLLMSENKGTMLAQVSNLRDLIGEHPYDWATNRLYVGRVTGDMANRRMGAPYITYADAGMFISQLLQIIEDHGSIYEAVTSDSSHIFPSDSIAWLLGDCFLERMAMQIDRILLYLCEITGLWAEQTGWTLHCPVDACVWRFVDKFIPTWRNLFDTFDIASIFGLTKETDLWFAAYAYEQRLLNDGEGKYFYFEKYYNKKITKERCDYKEANNRRRLRATVPTV